MFKSFALALLVATTQAQKRGDDDGSNQLNAKYRDMINSSDCGSQNPLKVNLWTYIQKTEGEDAYELHGDTVTTFEGYIWPNIQYGWCMHMTTDAEENKIWDCQQVDVKVAESAEAGVAEFKTESEISQFSEVTDWQYTGTRDNFSWANVKAAGTAMVRDQVADAAGVLSESAQTTANHNWAKSGAKSFTNCSSVGGKIKCAKPAEDASLDDRMKTGINLHWFRNFQTSDAPGYDAQFNGAIDKGKEYEVFAFLWSWEDADDDKLKKEPTFECLNDPGAAPYNVTPITEAAWTKVYKEPEVVVPDEEEDTDKTTTNTEEDHATMATISATALLSAVYTLAF